MRTLLIAVAVSALAGCATTRDDAEIARVKYQAMAELNKPLFTMKCPETGCSFTELTVNNPNTVTIPKESNGWDLAGKVVDGVVRIAPYAATAYVAAEGLRAAAGAVSNSYNSNAQSTDGSNNNSTSSQTQTTTDNSSQSSVENTDSGNSTTDTTSTTTSSADVTTTTTSTDSHNVTETITTDSTHTPTVVTQPAPVVVP